MMKNRARILCLGGILVLIGLAGRGTAAEGTSPSDDAALARRRTPVVEAVERISPTVVNISTQRLIPVSGLGTSRGGGIFSSPFDDLLRMLPGPTYYERATSLGSGVFVDKDGYIVTNAHVVSQASQILITMLDGSTHKAQLIGEDIDNDVAVLKVEEEGPFPFLPFGSSDDLMVGETVIAVGNPFGLQHTVTTGVLSAQEREIDIDNRTFPGLIQTDAAINPGNSGGPLVNINGKLIGINTAIQAGAEGIGFAIPVRRVKRVYDEVVYDVVSLEESLGLRIQKVTPAIATYYGLGQKGGVLIVDAARDGLAEKAGLERGDVITALDGKPVADINDYLRLLDRHDDGDLVVDFVRRREDTPQEVKITPERKIGRKQGDTAGPWFGMTVRSMDNRTASKQGWDLDEGVIVDKVDPDSESDTVGIRRGDLIMYIGRFEVRSVSDFNRAAREYATQPEQVQVRVWRPGFRTPVVVTLKRVGA